MPDKILVTGASGFVGSALCDRLDVLGVPFAGAMRQRSALPSRVQIGDMNAQTDWSTALQDCDVVVHLAARVHVMEDKSSDPLAAFRAVNVDATLNLARQAVRSGIRRFVYVSSIKVNGEQTHAKAFTSVDMPAPSDPYGISKLEAEQALSMLAQQTGLQLVIVRPPLVYGPGVRANFLKLMQLLKRGIPLPLGAIHNRRSMVALDNLIDLLIACCRHPRAAGQTFLVSDDRDLSMTDLLRMLSGAMGKSALLFALPAGLLSGCAALLGKSAAASRLLGSLQVDLEHTKSTLDWKPPVSVENAIQKTVDYFLSHS
ncbi:NAD dependent epimerase/dehydratase family protein [Janthinobacterium agaricidamnosum NBRC 102515 = DSM 9628]|uniref:NAD dependent epimerase/dehydratase family protein n=1 Tax=Janthinobacterium agaricidamnosum NBRC 102515 = DSM 9628 TaxID=1349767 RepID=W0V1W3_9BURK|nr:NAD dependent epimerase/dehydratase family protein [Janthinobacterium agaricidamnosum NBRC 102515 = DSM 9628]